MGGFDYHVRCKEIELTHVCFADDLFLLASATSKSLQVIKKSLSQFGCLSGLVANVNKSCVYVDNMGEDKKNSIKGLLNMQMGSLPVKYLGVPLIVGRMKR